MLTFDAIKRACTEEQMKHVHSAFGSLSSQQRKMVIKDMDKAMNNSDAQRFELYKILMIVINIVKESNVSAEEPVSFDTGDKKPVKKRYTPLSVMHEKCVRWSD